MVSSVVKIEDIERAFVDFYRVMMNSEHFRVFFKSQEQVDKLIFFQAANFYQSLTMTEEAFQDNYIKLGLMHAKMKLPFEDIISALRMIRDHLLKNSKIDQSFIYNIIEEMERYFAKGYLDYDFQDVLNQLEFSVENVNKNYCEADQAILIKPLNWLSGIIRSFQEGEPLTLVDIEALETCSLTAKIKRIKIKNTLKKSIQVSHADQHALALNMAYFFVKVIICLLILCSQNCSLPLYH